MFFNSCGIQTRVDFLEDVNGRKNKMEVIVKIKKLPPTKVGGFMVKGSIFLKMKKRLLNTIWNSQMKT